MNCGDRMIELKPIGWVRSEVEDARDDHWHDVPSVIELAPEIPTDAIRGIEEFSHLQVVFHFHGVDEATVCEDARHPRNNPEWPVVGIFAQRARRRPNRLGLSVSRLVRVEGRRLHLLDLDAIDGTPVVDIKPFMREFAPREPVRQPRWSEELMANYYV